MRLSILALFAALAFALPLLADEKTDLAGRWVVYGNGLYSQKKAAEAEQAYLKATTLDGANALAWQGLGNALALQGKKPEAIQAYKKSLELKPENPQLSAYLAKLEAPGSALAPAAAGAEDLEAWSETMEDAQVLSLQGKAAQAAEAYQAILKRNPPQAVAAKAWQGLGDSFYTLGRPEEARQAFEKSLALDPSNAKLKSFMAEHLGPQARAAGAGDWVAPLWRSAILPGWGQAFNGELGKGLAVGGLTLASLAGVAYTYTAASKAYDEYQALGSDAKDGDFSDKYSQVQSLGTANHILWIAFAAGYAYNLADAATGARPAAQMTLSTTSAGTLVAGIRTAY